MDKFFSWLLIALLAVPFPAQGYQSNLLESGVLHSRLVIESGVAVQVSNDLIIAEDGELVLQSGSSLLFESGHSLIVRGAIIADGSELDKVRLGAQDWSQPWNGLSVAPEARLCLLRGTVISHFLGPIQLSNSNLELESVQLVDGLNNRLIIGYPDQVQTNPVLIQNLEFANYGLGGGMRQVGLKIWGQAVHLEASQVVLHHLELPGLEKADFSVEAELSGAAPSRIQFSQLQTSRGCRFEFDSDSAFWHWWLVPVSAGCYRGVVPVLFVPGFGTSINLAKLANAQDMSPDPQGWRFMPSLTPGYTALFQFFIQHQIPYDTAFYDWRLPANQAVSGYLIPKIQALKARYKTDKINIVAHSFGGILARVYLQGQSYQGDVLNLVQYGTPNQGLAKVYSVLEGGDLPEDWQVLLPLLRLYQLEQFYDPLPLPKLVRKLFPSAAELMPIYPALWRQGELIDPSKYSISNPLLPGLNQGLSSLLQRTKTYLMYSSDLPTLEQLYIGPSNSSQTYYPDGQIQFSLNLGLNGDGTVPTVSAVLPGFQLIQLHAEHSNLTAQGHPELLRILYPQLEPAELESNPPLLNQDWLWFTVRSPAPVFLTLPSGEVLSGDQSGPIYSSLSTNQTGPVAEYEVSDQVQWLVVPNQPGNYQLAFWGEPGEVVQYYVNSSSVQSIQLPESGIDTVQYSAQDGWLPSYSIQPTPPTCL